MPDPVFLFPLRRHRLLAVASALGLCTAVALGASAPADALDVRPPEISLWHDFTLGSPSASARVLTEDVAGNIWFFDWDTDDLVRIDVHTHALTSFDLGRANVLAIASDAGGAIWFSNGTSFSIDRLDPTTGIVTPFALPPGFGFPPTSLAVTPDGSIWFPDPFAPELHSLTLGGTFISVSEPRGEVIRGVVTTPDGRIGYSRDGSDGAGFFDPVAGRFSDTGAGPGIVGEITVSKSGDVWVGGANEFTRIEPDGSIAIYPVVAPGPDQVVPLDMTAGVLSDVYFLDEHYGFGSINSSGVVHFSHISGRPDSLELDGEDHVWINELWGSSHLRWN